MILGRRWAYLAGRLARALAGTACAVGACGTIAAGLIPDLRQGSPDALGTTSLALVGVVLLQAIAARIRFASPSARAQRVSRLARLAPSLADLEIGLALLAAVYAGVALTGGADSPVRPLVYLYVAFAATFQARASVVAVLLGAMLLDASMSPSLLVLGQHAGFLLAAVAAHALFLRGLMQRLVRDHKKRLEEEVRAMRDEAREFRLIASALGADSRAPRTREEEERKLAEGAVETIHASMFYTLELLKKSLELNTCILLWLDDDGEHLKIKELVTDSDCIVETALPADAGALGAIVRDRLVLSLQNPKRGHVPYYAGPEEVGAFLGTPVVEDGHLRGVLCADRRSGRAFTEADEALLGGASQQILRSIQSERVFSAVERSKYEHERFYRASAMLGRALTLEQVMDTAIDAAREIVEFDLASIALFDKDQKKHRVHRVRVADDAGEIVNVQTLEGLEFRDNSGLASMVVKNKHYLPAGGELRDQETPVFTRKVRLKGVESLLVLPLVCADEAIGTFTLAARKRTAFGKDSREMLGVIANQVAVSLENAKMYRAMERLATTDGLTGLTNHRTFQEKLADLLGRCQRHGLKMAMILTDIDHFKKVNDTYGHPVGDQVLRGVAKVVADQVRKIDVVARYGGEEFAILMEGTDAEGARILAERIRDEVRKVEFPSDKGGFSVTLSLGIADFPEDAPEKEALVERADQALYHAKHSGRNRSITYKVFQASRAKKAG
jgi:two-component system, cell cycle response regulator